MYRNDLDAALARIEALERDCKNYEEVVALSKKTIGSQLEEIRALKMRTSHAHDSAPVTVSPSRPMTGHIIDAHRYNHGQSNTWAFNGGSSNGSNRGRW